MTAGFVHQVGQALPADGFEWRDRNGSLIDFSSGWTFAAKIAAANDPLNTLLTVNTGITGAATAPNVVINWVNSSFDTLPAALAGTVYVISLSATRTADGKVNRFRPTWQNAATLTLFPAAS